VVVRPLRIDPSAVAAACQDLTASDRSSYRPRRARRLVLESL
jgi:hypothetical protein